MIKDIIYNGITATPSDYSSPDGDLATAINLIPEEGGLVPQLPPAELKLQNGNILLLEEGEVLKHIHSTASYKHYITQKEYNLYYIDDDSGEKKKILTYENNIYDVKSIGNVLIVLTDTGINFLLWKLNKKEGLFFYENKNMAINTLIQFGLVFDDVRTIPENPVTNPYTIFHDFNQFFNTIGYGSNTTPKAAWNFYGNDEYRQKVSDTIKIELGNLINKSKKENKFVFPFLVRYALKMYDGSVANISPAVLMIPSSLYSPYCGMEVLGDRTIDRYDENLTNAEGVVQRVHPVFIAPNFDLYYKCSGDLELFEDIVEAVNIYVSAPFYTYYQDYNITGFHESFLNGSFSESRTSSNPYPAQDPTEKSILNNEWSVCSIDKGINFDRHENINFIEDKLNISSSRKQYYPRYFDAIMPIKSSDQINDEINNCSTFYLIKSIPIKEIDKSGNFVKLEMSEQTLETLETQEELKEENSEIFNKIIAKNAFVYNSRINIYNLILNKEFIFNINTLFTCIQNKNDETKYSIQIRFLTYNQEGESSNPIIIGNDSICYMNTPLLRYIYVPIADIDKAYVCITDITNSTKKVYEVSMNQHSFMIGSYHGGGILPVSGFSEIYEIFGVEENTSVKEIDEFPELSSNTETDYNVNTEIRSSLVNNPFVFPSENISYLPSDIIHVSTAAKPLSEGQFGQYPLYAFTKDGIYAIEVSPDGSYSSRQPISRDICINANGILQIDSAVLFPTDRGIMLISGSETTCITESITSSDVFDLRKLPNSDKLKDIFNGFSREQLSGFDKLDFREFVKTCRGIYDYNGQRIIYYSKDKPYAYAFSLKSKTWGMILSDIVSSIDAYPKAIAQTKDNKLIDFSSKSEIKNVPVLLITRPFSMGNNQYKTIQTIIQRGNLKRGHVKQVLYGSNDLEQWHTIWSSTDENMRGFRGSPYKYFRLAVIGNLDKDESIFGFTTEFEDRLTNRLR